jgi:hypothetical protein
MSKREEWMLGDDDLPFNFDSLDSRKNEKESLKSISEKEKAAIAAERELNPVLRKQAEGDVLRRAPPSSPTQSIEWTTVLVKRAISMIESGEKTFENAAIDRFGSIDAFEDAIRQVEGYKRTKFNIKIPKTTSVGNNTRRDFREVKEKDNSYICSLPLEDVNKLMAKKMKAELEGDYETSRHIEDQITKLKQDQAKPKPKEKLTLLPSETYNKRKAEKDMSIAELLRHEKLASSKEYDREMERGITGNKRFKDDLDTLDEQVKIDSSQEKSNTFDVRGKSIDEFKKKEKITKECWFCTDSDRFKMERASDWIVAYGNYTYLAIPKSRSLHPLHCLIVPMSHVCSLLDCREFEDEIWEEVRNFKKCLLQMAAKQDRSYVFMECVMRSEDVRRHTFIDCIPTPRGQYADHVKGHFLKALQETDEEWSHNKKVIDTSLKPGGLRSALPRKHFPYFYADFRLDQGYAHVIEDAEKFGSGDFGRDLMASLLKISRNDWRTHRTNRDEMTKFCDLFGSFDWTRNLDN